jgi:hypothetical protein
MAATVRLSRNPVAEAAAIRKAMVTIDALFRTNERDLSSADLAELHTLADELNRRLRQTLRNLDATLAKALCLGHQDDRPT